MIWKFCAFALTGERSFKDPLRSFASARTSILKKDCPGEAKISPGKSGGIAHLKKELDQLCSRATSAMDGTVGALFTGLNTGIVFRPVSAHHHSLCGLAKTQLEI